MNPLWTQLAAAAGLSLTEAQHVLLDRYLDLLLEANKLMNLTRIDDRSAAELGHVGDALTVLPFLPRGAHRLVDVGSGGGVPGIPLAIVRPDVQVTLVESTKKKAVFLERTAVTLGLVNVRVLPERAEDVAQGEMRESFDVAIARALAPLALVGEWCLPLVKVGGKLLAMKGPKVEEELPAARKAIELLGGGEVAVRAVELRGVENHVVVEVRKVGRTDTRYPRPPSQTKSKAL
jgi:16S rRNA (guanine527-N7)-methyltransferase